MEQTLTHHFIDDRAIPDVDGIEPWDLAMDTMRKYSAFPPSKVRVSDDGRTMTLKMTGSRLAEEYVRMARVVITALELPLEIKRDRFTIGDVVFEDNLLIIYSDRYKPWLIG